MKADEEWARLIREMWEEKREADDILSWYLGRKRELGDLDEF